MIETPQIIQWANQRSRTIADDLERLYAIITAYQSDYAAQGINALITAAGNTDIIDDGSSVDGRSQITGLQLQNLNAALTQIKTALDTTLVPGVGATAKSVFDGIQVAGSPR